MHKPRILTRQGQKSIKQNKSVTDTVKTKMQDVLLQTDSDPAEKKLKTESKDIEQTLVAKETNTNLNLPTYELAKNYTNEYFLIRIPKTNEQTKPNIRNKVKRLMINNNNIKNDANKENCTQVLQPKINNKNNKPLTEDHDHYTLKIKRHHNEIIKKTEQICNEKFHEIDIFSIFGKSVGDQLRSFPLSAAIPLQNKIQDLITEERLKL